MKSEQNILRRERTKIRNNSIIIIPKLLIDELKPKTIIELNIGVPEKNE